MSEEHLLERGYAVWPGDAELAKEVRETVADRLQMVGSMDDELVSVQAELSKELSYFPRTMIERHMERFKMLIGPDILIQKYPYLRIARPGKPQDNIGYHRDTLYGSSPYELSVLIALTDMVGGAAFSVLPGSQMKPEGYYPYTIGDPQCEKGSVKHSLGFLYSPKVFGPEVRRQMQRVAIKAGDMLVFFPSLIHGQEVNASASIRLSYDVRLCNTFAPVNTARGVHDDYYEPMCAGHTTLVAQAYTDG